MKTKKLLCLFLSMLMVASIIPINVSAIDKNTALTGVFTYYIETYEQLKNHAAIAQSDCRYVLQNDILQEDNLNDLEVIIPTGAVFNLDLNGYNIKRITQGNDCALFRIQSEGIMKIYDTSSNGTGGCSFSEGYADYQKAVFYNDGGELEIINGYYEIFSPFEQGDCSILRTTSGYTNIYDGIFDSSSSWGGDTISVGHNAYLYEVPHVNIFGGEFYGKYSNIDVTPFDTYLKYGCLYPSVYVLGGNFYITKESESSGFCYCNNGYGRVIVAQGKVPSKCLNSRDQMFLDGVSKKHVTDTIDDYTTGYYEVTAPTVIMSEGIDYYYRLINLCKKAEVLSYGESVYEMHKDDFDYILNTIDSVIVAETEKTSPELKAENRTADHQYINWYMVDESEYNGKETNWTHLGDIQDVSQWTPERPEEGKSYIIRLVATNSKLETYEDIIRLSFAPLKKAEIIESVKISDLEAPVAGKAPDFELSTEEAFYINGIYWTDITDSKNPISLKETDTFETDHEYKLEIWIRANEFYNFKTDSDDFIDIKAFVNDKEVEVILPGSPISAELALTFTVGSEDETTVSTEPTEPSEATKPSEGIETTPTESTRPSETIATTPSTDSSEPSEDKGILGDVDGNGKVNIKDATMIQKAVAKIISLTDSEQIRADVNADAKVNIKDATAIQKYVAKIETGLPIGEPVK